MIEQFKGIYHFLSNFFYLIGYLSKGIVYDKIYYPTVEHFYQAMKTMDRLQRIAIADASSPAIAKKMGSKKGYKGFKIVLRVDWEDIKVKVMAYGLIQKFKDPVLRAMLIDTYPHHLVEGNYWHDNTWGACTCYKCRGIPKQNMLGLLLMRIREAIINGQSLDLAF